jgi:hypothetical protein
LRRSPTRTSELLNTSKCGRCQAAAFFHFAFKVYTAMTPEQAACVRITNDRDCKDRLRNFTPPPSGATSLDWALSYVRAGLSIFPCDASRRPLIERGFHGGSTDERTIAAWGRRWPSTDWGGAVPERLIVVDLDVKTGRNGRRDFEELEGRPAESIQTPISTTPSAGLHIWYDAGDRRLCQIGGRIPGHPGIDTRAGGKGFVVLPGPNNGRTWLRPLSTPLAPALAWLPAEDVRAASAVTAERPAPFAAPTPFAHYAFNASLPGIVRTIERAVEGTRNSILFWGACRLGEFVRVGLVDEPWAAELLLLAAQRCGLPANEATRTIMSGLRRPE